MTHRTQCPYRDRPRFHDTLDSVKFVCKEFWAHMFGKQVDKLQSNSKGVYVLHDRAFRPLQNASLAAVGDSSGGVGDETAAAAAGVSMLSVTGDTSATAGAAAVGAVTAKAALHLHIELAVGAIIGALRALGVDAAVTPTITIGRDRVAVDDGATTSAPAVAAGLAVQFTVVDQVRTREVATAAATVVAPATATAAVATTTTAATAT